MAFKVMTWNVEKPVPARVNVRTRHASGAGGRPRPLDTTAAEARATDARNGLRLDVRATSRAWQNVIRFGTCRTTYSLPAGGDRRRSHPRHVLRFRRIASTGWEDGSSQAGFEIAVVRVVDRGVRGADLPSAEGKAERVVVHEQGVELERRRQGARDLLARARRAALGLDVV
jgi:hypothetical protein